MGDKLFQFKLKLLKKHAERCKQKKELMDAYAEYLPEKKIRKVSNVMLFVIIVAITVYTVASFWITYMTGAYIDSTLTTCFYAFWTSEIVLLAGIRVSKVIKTPKHNNSESKMEYESTEDFDAIEYDIE